MLLKNKVAVIYGAGGIIGGAVARAFARAGAELYLAGRMRAKLDAVARDVIAGGGRAEAEEVDALDERAVQQHTDAVAAQAGCIDIALNAVGIVHVQGTPLAELSLEDYSRPIVAYTQTNFITAKAVARHMMKQGSGAILMLSTPASRMPGPGFLGHSVLHVPESKRSHAILPARSAGTAYAFCACGRTRFRKRCQTARMLGKCSARLLRARA